MERHDTLEQGAAAIVLAARMGLRLYPHHDGKNVAIEKFGEPPEPNDYETVKQMLKAAKPAVLQLFDSKKEIETYIETLNKNLEGLSDESYRIAVHLTDLEAAYELIWKGKKP